MIDIKTEKGNTEIREISGTAPELITDCVIIIGIVSRTMEKHNLKHAGALKDMLKDGYFAEKALLPCEGKHPETTTQISKKAVTEGLFALQKLMEKVAKGENYVAD